MAVSAATTTLPAQDAALLELSLEELLEVRVQGASFFDETPLSSPSSVSLVERNRFASTAARTVGELLNTFPSTLSTVGSGHSRYVALRGYYGDGDPKGIAVRFDGVPLNRLRQASGAMELDGFDLSVLDRVEVVRGPGSVLYGNNAFHGTVNLQTVSLEESDSELRATIGTHDFGAVSGIGREQWANQALLASVAWRRLGNAHQDYRYIDPVDGVEKTGTRSLERESHNALLKYRADLGEQFTFEATGFYIDFQGNQLPGFGEFLGDSTMRGRDWSAYGSETGLLKLQGRWRTENIGTLEVAVFGWTNDDHFSVDLRGAIGVDQYLLDEWREEDFIGTSVIHRWSFANGSLLAYGYEYGNGVLGSFDFQLTGPGDFPILERTSRPESGYRREVHSLVLDGRQAIAAIDLDVVYGLRLDAYSDFDRQLSPRLGLIQKLGSGGRAKLIYGHAFRAPNLIELYGSPVYGFEEDLQPETLDSLEAVLQWRFESALLTLTAFRNWWSDRIGVFSETEENGNEILRYLNRGESEAHGIELESSFRWGSVSLDLSASYVKSRRVDLEMDFDAFPSLIANLRLGYTHAETWAVYLNNRIMQTERLSETEVPVPDAPTDDTFWRTDLVWQGKVMEGWNLEVAVRNLFNRANALPSARGHVRGLPDLGRDLSVSLRVGF